MFYYIYDKTQSHVILTCSYDIRYQLNYSGNQITSMIVMQYIEHRCWYQLTSIITITDYMFIPPYN